MYLKSVFKAGSDSRRLVDIRFSRIEAFASPSNKFQINFKYISHIYQIYVKYICFTAVRPLLRFLFGMQTCLVNAGGVELQILQMKSLERRVRVYEIRLFDLYIKDEVRQNKLLAQSFYLILTKQSFKSQF